MPPGRGWYGVYTIEGRKCEDSVNSVGMNRVEQLTCTMALGYRKLTFSN